MFQFPSLNFIPYQGGAAGSLISTITLDPATDTQFTVPVSGLYQNQVVYTTGVIIMNENNDVSVSVVAGPLSLTIQPFTRDYVLLDKNVTTQLTFTISTAKTSVLFFIGTPPISTQILNYFGANQATQSILAANFLGNMSPIINSGFTEWPTGTSISSATSGEYGPEGWMLKAGSASSVVFRQALGGVFPSYYGACVQRNSGSGDTTTIQLGTALTTLDSAQFQGQLITVSYDLEIGANFTSNNLTVNLVYGSGIDQNIFAPFSGQTTIGTQVVSIGSGFQWARQTFTASGVVPTTATQVGIIFSHTPSGTAGANDSFTISRVQFDIGTTAQLYRAVPQLIERTRCLEFFERLNGENVANNGYGIALALSATSAYGLIGFSRKRVVPSISFNGTFNTVTPSGQVAINSGTANNVGQTNSGFSLTIPSASFAPGVAVVIIDGGSSYIDVNARM